MFANINAIYPLYTFELLNSFRVLSESQYKLKIKSNKYLNFETDEQLCIGFANGKTTEKCSIYNLQYK